MGKRVLIGVLVLVVIIPTSLFLYSTEKCVDSNEQCAGNRDGAKCDYGIWCDRLGRICGGQSCVGVSPGECFQGKCVPLKISKEVTVSTDKRDYEQGETVRITIKNSLDQSIWYWQKLFASRIEIFENDSWKEVERQHPCYCTTCSLESSELLESKPGETINDNWDMKTRSLRDCANGETAEPGRYRIIFTYYSASHAKEEKYVYSNKFEIKEEITCDWCGQCCVKIPISEEDCENAGGIFDGQCACPEVIPPEGFICIEDKEMCLARPKTGIQQ